MELVDAGEFCECGGGEGWIIIQSVLGQSRLNTFSQRTKHKVIENPGSLMKTKVASAEWLENAKNEWCLVSHQPGRVKKKKKKQLYRDGV